MELETGTNPMTQKEIIKAYLRDAQGSWIPAYKLRSVSTPYGWIGHQGDRMCRKLAEEGTIERTLIGRYAHYRAKQPQSFTIYKVEGLGKKIVVPNY